MDRFFELLAAFPEVSSAIVITTVVATAIAWILDRRKILIESERHKAELRRLRREEAAHATPVAIRLPTAEEVAKFSRRTGVIILLLVSVTSLAVLSYAGSLRKCRSELRRLEDGIESLQTVIRGQTKQVATARELQRRFGDLELRCDRAVREAGSLAAQLRRREDEIRRSAAERDRLVAEVAALGARTADLERERLDLLARLEREGARPERDPEVAWIIQYAIIYEDLYGTFRDVLVSTDLALTRPLFEHMLASEDPDVRWGALWYLSELGERAKPLLDRVRRLIEDPNESVRTAAIFAVGRLDAGSRAQAIRDLAAALRSEDPEVREHVLWMLAGFGSEAREVLPEIKARLEDESNDVRSAAAAAIHLIEGPKD